MTQMTDNTLIEAIELTDKIRREHNGVFQVTLYMGHDGNNACSFRDYEKTIGHGESGVNLLTAVTIACADWRWRNLTRTPWGKSTVMDSVQMAIESFGSSIGVFNSASFYQAINNPDAYAIITDSQINSILENHPRIVRLHGGSHWLLIPDEMTRFGCESSE